MGIKLLVVLLACALAHGRTFGRIPGTRPVAYSTDCEPVSGHPGSTEKAKHRYELSTFTADFATAEAFCVSNGGNLASIHNDDHEEEVEALHSGGADVWIGLHDPSDSELAFKWTDGSCVNYEAWAPGEPNEAGSGEDCVHISYGLGGWNDHMCSSSKLFVCQYPAKIAGETCLNDKDCNHGACANGICLSLCAASGTGGCDTGEFCSDDSQCASTGCSTDTWTCYEDDSEIETDYSGCVAHNVGEVGTLVNGLSLFASTYQGCYIKSGPSTYDAPSAPGSCGFIPDHGGVAFHQRCHCVDEPIETCRTHCNADPNCVGYTAINLDFESVQGCQTATTSPCTGTSVPVVLVEKPITFGDVLRDEITGQQL